MAVEAERGLPPACHACALATSAPLPASGGIQPDPNDPRLLVGGVQGTRLLERYLTAKGLSLSQQYALPFDHDIVALVGMSNPHKSYNAAEIVRLAGGWFDGFFTVGNFLNTDALLANLVEQGGYAPTTDKAAPHDQEFMVLTGVAALRFGFTPPGYEFLFSRVESLAEEWRRSLATQASTPGFGAWLRERGGVSGL